MMRFFVVALLMLLTTDAAIATTPAGLTLSLTTDKPLYRSGDRIDLSIMLENRSGEPMTINRRLAYPGPDLTVEITDPSGMRLRWLPPAPPPPVLESDFVRLGPGQRFEVTLQDISRHLFDKLERTGEYRATATYRNQDGGSQWNHVAWTGSIESRVVTFQWGG